jgi:hypothetical protein
VPHAHRSVALLPLLAALSLVVVGCGSGSTGPQTKPSTYAGNYTGILEGAGASGTVAIDVGQVSADRAGEGVVHTESGNSVTVTLTTSSGSITLTGIISGDVATVTSTAPPATCAITFTTTGATGSCTEAPYGTFSLIAFVLVNGIEVTAYCGTQSAGTVATVNPGATLGGVVSGTSMYLIVAPAAGTPVLYTGTLASGSVSLTSGSSAAVYTGTEMSDGASIGGTITTGGTGSWALMNPCGQGRLTVSTNAVPASATVGSTTTITPNPVAITNGGSGTLGVLGVGATTYTPSATSGWLQASLTSPTTTSGTLSLSVTPLSGMAAGTYTASVPITASLGTGNPQTVTVTLTINSGQSQPALVLSANSATLTTTVGAAPPPATAQVTATSGTAGGLSASVAYGAGATGWLTANISPSATPATLTVAAPAAASLAAATYSATVMVSSTTTGVASVTFGVTLTVNAVSGACTITTSPTLPTLTVGTVADVLLTTTGSCPTTGSNSWTVTNGSLPGGLAIPLGGTLPEIYGAPTASGHYGFFTVNLINSVTGAVASKMIDSGTVQPQGACAIGPVPEPAGTVGVLYAQGFVASTNCTSASDNSALWAWTISTGAPPGLTFDNPIDGVKDVGLTGTPTQAGTFTFTVTFTNTNQVSGANEASATQHYTMIIAPAPSASRVRAARTSARVR